MSAAVKLPDVKRSLNRVDSKSGKSNDHNQSRPKSGTVREGLVDGETLVNAYAELKEKHDHRKEAFDQVSFERSLLMFSFKCVHLSAVSALRQVRGCRTEIGR